MIIWRGWGVIGAAFPLLGVALAMMLWSTTGAVGSPQGLVGIGLILGAAGAFLLGRHLNETSVEAKAASLLAEREAQLEMLVRNGQFQMAAGMPVAGSYEEGRQQADAVLDSERAQVRGALRNRHTLFFIPVQWAAVVVAVIGAVVLVTGLTAL